MVRCEASCKIVRCAETFARPQLYESSIDTPP